MNIFFLDRDPILAAQALCDKHVVKMILESAQIECTIINESHKDFRPQTAPYRSTHVNHPCTIWARKSPENFEWLHNHAMALCEEYTFRYGKVHKSKEVLEWCGKNRVTKLLSGLTPPALAMPDEYKTVNKTRDLIGEAVISYRRYYVFDKMVNISCEWTRRSPPDWIEEIKNEKTVAHSL